MPSEQIYMYWNSMHRFETNARQKQNKPPNRIDYVQFISCFSDLHILQSPDAPSRHISVDYHYHKKVYNCLSIFCSCITITSNSYHAIYHPHKS